MKRTTDHQFDRYLERLRELPFVREAQVPVREPKVAGRQADALLVLKMPKGERHEYFVELKRTNLTLGIADHFLALHATQKQPAAAHAQNAPQWILLAPYVPRTIGRRLADNGANYLDLEGNCHLRLDERYIAQIEGRLPTRREPEGRGIRAPGFQVLFAILADPQLLNEGIVRVAELAGVGKTTVADTFARLEREGFIATVDNERHLLQPKALLDRWLVGYANTVRPRLLVGRYRAREEDPKALEQRIEETIGEDVQWAWGGGAAALRLTQHYRGETTVLHVQHADPGLTKRLHLLRDANGPLHVLTVPGPVAFAGALPRTVHPLLVYTELLTTGNERAREAALQIHERYLQALT